MKRLNLLAAACLASFLLAACSADLRRKVPPLEDVLHAGPLAKILVYSGNVALGQSGPSAEGVTVAIGGTAAFSAQGRDVNDRPVRVTPTWTANKPDLLEIKPDTGDIVLIRGLREGTVSVVAEYKGVKKTVEYIFVK